MLPDRHQLELAVGATGEDQTPDLARPEGVDQLSRIFLLSHRIRKAGSFEHLNNILPTWITPTLRGDQSHTCLSKIVEISHQILMVGEPGTAYENEYFFRHALMQEAVYSDLLPGERTMLQETAAGGRPTIVVG